MLKVDAPSDTEVMTVYTDDGPLGKCSFVGGDFVVEAETSDNKREIMKLIRYKFRLQKNRALRKGIVLSKADFFQDLPRYMSGTMFYVLKPDADISAFVPEDLQELFRSKLPLQK